MRKNRSSREESANAASSAREPAFVAWVRLSEHYLVHGALTVTYPTIPKTPGRTQHLYVSGPVITKGNLGIHDGAERLQFHGLAKETEPNLATCLNFGSLFGLGWFSSCGRDIQHSHTSGPLLSELRSDVSALPIAHTHTPSLSQNTTCSTYQNATAADIDFCMGMQRQQENLGLSVRPST